MSEDNAQKLRDQADRGSEAARVYGSPLVKEFFAKARAALRAEWENSAPADAAAREHQWRLYQAVVTLEECFTTTIRTGAFAEKKLKEAATADKPGLVKRAIARVV